MLVGRQHHASGDDTDTMRVIAGRLLAHERRLQLL